MINLINSEKEQKMAKYEDKLISWRQADQESLDGMTMLGSHAKLIKLDQADGAS